MKKFEDEFEELIHHLKKLFNQKQSITPSSLIQRHSHAVLRQDRYMVVTHHNKPTLVILDVRMVEKIRKCLVKMGYIKDKSLFEEGEILEPRARVQPKPESISFNLGDKSEESGEQEDVQPRED